MLGNLVQVSTDSRHFESDLALVKFGMAGFTQGQEVRECIFPAVLSVDNMMGLQTHPTFAALLTDIAIPHQAGFALIFVQPRRVLILTAFQVRVVETGNIYLNVFDHKV